MVGVLSSLMYAGLVLAQYDGAGPLPLGRCGRRAAAAAGGALHRRPERLRLHGGRGAERLPRRRAAARRRSSWSEASTQLADLQAFSQHVIDSLTSGLATTRHGRADPDVQPRRRNDHRRCRPSDAVGRRARRGAAAARRTFAALFGPRDGPAAAAAASSSASRRADGRQIELGLSTRAADHAARRERLPLHLPGRHRGAEAASARRACSSGWRRSARWPPASRTRSATRWRRCPGRSRSCARSCR